MHASGFDVLNANPRRITQGFEPRLVFGFLPLYQAQPLAKNFARVLIATRRNKPLQESFLVISKDYVAGRHGCAYVLE
jgi:hypothetical protein